MSRVHARVVLLIVMVLQLLSQNWSYQSQDDSSIVVDTDLGSVVGMRQDTVNAYLGIPFAEPPIGRYRFRPPRPKRPWFPSLFQAFNFSAECLQSNLYASETSDQRPTDEDCLYLNIWQPSKQKKDSLSPVMIWIYGGAFLHGGASRQEYYGNKLAERGVIVVSLNYRLGALGFLVSVSDGLYGNYGLADQKLAIQWVQNNIRNFGGDPNRITLFGESAGAMSIGLHLLDQQNLHQRQLSRNPNRVVRKAFHAVILQSNPLGYKYRPVSVANFIGASFREQLDCEDLKCMQSESAEELIHVQDSLMAVPRSIGDFFTWGPVLTDASYYREARLRPGPLSNVTVRQPIEALKELQKVDVPVMIGTTSHEGNVFVFTAYPTMMPKLVYQALVFSFFRSVAPRVLKTYARYAKQVGNGPNPDYRQVLSQIIGDYLFRCPNKYFAAQLTGVGTSVFLYEFALATRTPGFPCCNGLSCHTCELPYVFNQIELIGADYSWQQYMHADGVASSLLPTDALSATDTDYGGEEGKLGLADIFDAATNWISGISRQSGSSSGSSRNQQRNNRHQVDHEVSRLIAEYWTTFAAFGDPNGLPSTTGASSGYEASTRPINAPWWPQLLGDLPSAKATREVQQATVNQMKLSLQDATQNDSNSSSNDDDELEEDLLDDEEVVLAQQQYATPFGYEDDDDFADIVEPTIINQGQNPRRSSNSRSRQYNKYYYDEEEEPHVADKYLWDVQDFERVLSNDYDDDDYDEPLTRHRKQKYRERLRRVQETLMRTGGSGTGEDDDATGFPTMQRGEIRKSRNSASAKNPRNGRGGDEQNLPHSYDDSDLMQPFFHAAQQQRRRGRLNANPRNGGINRNSNSPGSSSSNEERISRFTAGFESQKFMHHMLFDARTTVEIVENDCVCNFWNRLEYRF